MAKMNQGILGAFSGAIGPVIGSSWYGIPYMKSRPTKRAKSTSEKEKLTRTRFAMVHNWLQPLLDVVREGYKNHSLKSRGFNAAKSYVLKNAIEGTAPDLFINPALVKLSYGNLPISPGITVEKSGPAEIKFTWGPEIPADAHYADQVMLVAYNVEEKIARDILYGPLRGTGEATLPIPVAGKPFHIYLAFIAHDRSRQSDSVYLGEIEM
jgi:hypothetical protein